MNGPTSSELEALLARWAGIIRTAASRAGVHSPDHDDVVQDVRIRLWRELGRRSENLGAIPASYMYRAAWSAAIDLLRRRRREGSDRIPLEAAANQAAGMGGVDELLEEERVQKALARALATLPVDRRAVLRMHLEGMHRTRIAALLGWSEARTRNLLYRGLDQLREALAREGVGDTEQG